MILWNIRQRVGQTEIYHFGYVRSEHCFESGLVLILLSDSQVFISPSNIKLGVQLPFVFLALSGCCGFSLGLVVNFPIVHDRA